MKNVKKVLGLSVTSLAVVMLLGGCGSNKKAESSGVKLPDASYKVDKKMPAWKVDKSKDNQLTWYINAEWWNKKYGTDLITKQVKKDLNLDIKFIVGDDTKLNTYFASGDIPDIVTVLDANSEVARTANKWALPLQDLANKYDPYFNEVARKETLNWYKLADGKTYIVVTLGTAVGCGIVINNQIYKGAHGAAGEAGWSMQESLDYTQDLEDNSWNFTSGVIVGLCRHYQHESGKTISDARMILDLASHGDEIAGRVLDQYYDDVAKGLLNLICVFDPEVLLIGGGISANQSFLRHLSHRLDKIKLHHRSLNRLSNDTIAQVQPCLLKNDAGLIGAVYQVIKEKEKEMNRSSL